MLNPWFVSGFCESEATFTYSKAEKGYNLYFAIRQKSENRHIVEELRRFFADSGNIYLGRADLARAKRNLTEQSGSFSPTAYPERSEGSQEPSALRPQDEPSTNTKNSPKAHLASFRSIYYRVARLEELAIIIDHFDHYPLQGKKQEVYGLWKQMWLHKKEHYRDPDNFLLKGLAEQLSGLSKKST